MITGTSTTRGQHTRLRLAQYLYPALALRQVAQTEPVLPSIQGFALQPPQMRTLAKSALQPMFSANCGAQRTVRAPRGGHTILGTSITCSGSGWSKTFKTPTGSTMKSKGTTGTESAICSAVCRWTRSCGQGFQSGAGRIPLADATSSSELSSKYSASAFFCPRGASFTVMALAGFCLRGAAWCCASASAIATVSRSCRKNWRNRRCRRLIAAPGTLSTAMFDSIKLFSQFAYRKRATLRENGLGCCGCGCWWWWWCGPACNVRMSVVHAHAQCI